MNQAVQRLQQIVAVQQVSRHSSMLALQAQTASLLPLLQASLPGSGDAEGETELMASATDRLRSGLAASVQAARG